MTNEERQTLAQIARRLLRDGHISDVEGAFIGRLLASGQRPPTEYVPSAEQHGKSEQAQPGIAE